MMWSRYEPLECEECGGPTDTCADDYVDADGICRIPEPLLCRECEDGDYDEDKEEAA